MNTKELPIYGTRACSDEFALAFATEGGALVTCGCGRVHFSVGDPHHFEPGEYASLMATMADDPDRYIGHEGTVHYGRIHGRTEYTPTKRGNVQVVIGCPCNLAGATEEYMRENFGWIRDFLNSIAEDPAPSLACTA